MAKQDTQQISKKIPGGFSLEDLTDCWRVNNVNYRNGIYTIDLAKKLLDNGAEKTQDQWIEYSKQAILKNEFYLESFPLYHALFSSLFFNKENAQFKDKIEEARNFVSEMCIKYWLTTLTRIRHKAIGKDNVIHNYGMQDQHIIDENIIGDDEFVKNASDINVYKAILGNDDIILINNIYNWISGKDAYLYRLNNKPKKDHERVARFDTADDRFWLCCYGDPAYSDRGFGVRAKIMSTSR
jgi:hypothetical protein